MASGVSGKGWGWVALMGALFVGVGAGVALPKGGDLVPTVDGVGAFAVAARGQDLQSEWGEIRVSSSQRTLALLGKVAVSRPQMLVFPHAAAWPALAVPKGWKVAWVDERGQILEVQTGEGQPLSARGGDGIRQTRLLFAAPPSGPLGSVMEAGQRLLWTDSMPIEGGKGLR